MTQARRPRQFGSTEHLASEAIASYVDGELRMNAYLRASQASISSSRMVSSV